MVYFSSAESPTKHVRTVVPLTWIDKCAAAVISLGFDAEAVATAIATLEATPLGFAPYASPNALAEYLCEHVPAAAPHLRDGTTDDSIGKPADRTSISNLNPTNALADQVATLLYVAPISTAA